MAKIADTDKRSLPRIKIGGDVRVSGQIHGRALNLHHFGLSFQSDDVIAIGNKYLIDIKFPSSKVFQASAIVRWKFDQDGSFVYGAELNPLSSYNTNVVWKYLISERYKKICESTRSRQDRLEILKFAKKLVKYITQLIEIQNKLESMPRASSEATKPLLNDLTRINNEIVYAGDQLGQSLENKILLNKIKDDFRNVVGCWAFKSQIMKRGFDKPKGYPGDYETLEVIYDRRTFGEDGELGLLFDQYFLTNPYADAVRERMSDLKKEVFRTLSDQKVREEISILDLASGSAREYHEILSMPEIDLVKLPCKITLLDWDEDALSFSKGKLFGKRKNIQFEFLKEDLLNFIKEATFFDANGKQNLIYSIGLADYLPDRVLKKMIKVCSDGLKPGGKFILAHKDKEVSFSHLPPEWFCDWVFIPRTVDDVLELFKSSNLSQVYSWNVVRSISPDIFYVVLQKNV